MHFKVFAYKVQIWELEFSVQRNRFDLPAGGIPTFVLAGLRLLGYNRHDGTALGEEDSPRAVMM